MRKEPVYPNQYYHLYNRGVAKGNIFFKASHWSFFLRRMRKYFQPDLVDILAYCLMPNHYHILAFVKCDDFGNTVMHPFTVSFTRAINRDMERVGPLFQGPFQIKRVDSTEHLVQLTKYIHRNPVSANLVPKSEDWLYSSYQDFIGLRNGTLPKISFEVLGFKDSRAYQNYVEFPSNEEKINQFLFDET